MNEELFVKLMTNENEEETEWMKGEPKKEDIDNLNRILFRRTLNPELGRQIIGIKNIDPNSNYNEMGDKLFRDHVSTCSDLSSPFNDVPHIVRNGNWIPIHLIEELSELLIAVISGYHDVYSARNHQSQYTSNSTVIIQKMRIIEEIADVVIHINYFSTILRTIYPYNNNLFYTIDLNTNCNLIKLIKSEDVEDEAIFIADLSKTVAEIIKLIAKYLWKQNNVDDLYYAFKDFNDNILLKIFFNLSISYGEIVRAIRIKNNRGIASVLYNEKEQ